MPPDVVDFIIKGFDDPAPVIRGYSVRLPRHVAANETRAALDASAPSLTTRTRASGKPPSSSWRSSGRTKRPGFPVEDELIDEGRIETDVEAARLLGVTWARMTQVMDVMSLPVDVQEGSSAAPSTRSVRCEVTPSSAVATEHRSHRVGERR